MIHNQGKTGAHVVTCDICSEMEMRAGDVAQLAECLPGTLEMLGPGSIAV